MGDSEQAREETGTAEAGLRIGAVARLTGLSVHTLRKWEDRYQAVCPKQSAGGERLYSREDLNRLSLMRRLSGAGMHLGDLAALDLQALEQHWARLSGHPAHAGLGDAADRVLRIAAVGASVPGVIAAGGGPGLEVVACAASPAALDGALRDAAVDVCVCEFQTLQADTRRHVAEIVERTHARAVVVVYRLGARASVDALRRRGLALLRAPADARDLERAAREAFADAGAPLPWGAEAPPSAPDGPPPPPALSLETVARIAESSPRIRCECPRHIADLLFGLRAFEEYSAECENRSPDDAALHHYLWETSGRARALFEEALARVAKAEGIPLD